MTIDASLRRAQVTAKDRGDVVPDSKPKKADNPQLVMEAGVVRPVFKFGDGGGLTDAYGNVYDGYGNSGGSSITWTHTPSDTLDDTNLSNADDEDILVYDADDELYYPQSTDYLNIVRTEGTVPQQDYIPAWDTVAGKYIPQDPADLDIAMLNPATSVLEGEILVAGLAGTFNSVPQVTTDFVAATIQNPVDRTYTICQSLPYDVTITGNNSQIAVGSTTVTWPVGTISAGSPLEITLSGTSVDAEYLDLQLTFTYNLGIS